MRSRLSSTWKKARFKNVYPMYTFYNDRRFSIFGYKFTLINSKDSMELEIVNSSGFTELASGILGQSIRPKDYVINDDHRKDHKTSWF